ncbi:MAG TPA: TetR/AcrR family transcriptional regulator C-terminal domain-containing protein, partial [Jiangellales bacterium]|nr:TetR/AcrR family transcriptional regulator C-terminal domain-containing protein [Jiangellales bacterium]
MRFADRDGIDALSMRRLGRELGVEAMSLYNHVADKDDMLDGMVDMVWGEVKLPSSKGDWRAAIRGTGVSAHKLLVRHPWACSLTISSGRLRLARLRYIDAILGRLATAGFSDAHAYHAYHAIDSHVVGFSMWVNGHSMSALQRSEPAGQTMLRDVTQELPHLAEHVQQHRSGVGSGVDEFSLILDFILDGLGKVRRSS